MRHLTRLTAVTALAVVLLLAVSSQLPAERVDPLRAAFLATGAGRLDAVRYSGIGATYTGEGAGAAWTRTPFHRYDADVNLATGVVRQHLAPVPDGDTVTVAPPAGSAWDARAAGTGNDADAGAARASGGDIDGDAVPRAWLTPHGFLKAARAYDAHITPGVRETAIAFERGRYRVAGVLNERYQVDRVQVWALADGDARGGAAPRPRVDVRFSDYEPMAGTGTFPRHITEAREGRPVLDLWVWAARGVPSRLRLTPTF
jgi:hypothetical protein